jgi:hypothetical protein
MTTGLGYRNTGIRFPITATEKFKKPGSRTGIGFTGMVGRDEEDPIQFVPSKLTLATNNYMLSGLPQIHLFKTLR